MKLELVRSSQNIGSDFHAAARQMAVTVEVKEESGFHFAYWVASRVGANNHLDVFLELRLPLSTRRHETSQQTESALFEECSKIFTLYIEPLLRRTQDAPRGIVAGERVSHEIRQLQAIAHLKLHDLQQSLGQDNKNLNRRTAMSFQLVKSFGVGTVIDALSSFENVGKTTMTRRVTRARDAGLIEKTFLTSAPRGKAGE